MEISIKWCCIKNTSSPNLETIQFSFSRLEQTLVKTPWWGVNKTHCKFLTFEVGLRKLMQISLYRGGVSVSSNSLNQPMRSSINAQIVSLCYLYIVDNMALYLSSTLLNCWHFRQKVERNDSKVVRWHVRDASTPSNYYLHYVCM